jgi:hypothetical protein
MGGIIACRRSPRERFRRIELGIESRKQRLLVALNPGIGKAEVEGSKPLHHTEPTRSLV